jgi:pseudaminic acid cytidylyltransferase
LRLAVIPARGGSKRIPRKNVKLFAGRPMIAYAIDAARTSELFDRIVVSTDDEEIAAAALAHGAEVPFRRPDELADDSTPTVPVVSHAISCCRELGWDIEDVCCIYPGVPLLQPDDLRLALNRLNDGEEGYVFPVTHFASPMQRALMRDDSGHITPFFPQHANTRTQDLEPAFHDAGQFYWGNAAAWLAGKTLHLDAATIVLPAWRVVDIDTPDDWDRAERMYQTFRVD